MSGGPYPVGVGYGSDFNGMTRRLAPRYGDALLPVLERDACDGADVPPQAEDQRVQYPFTAHGATGTFDKQVTGGKTFDYNVDGLAHVGLVPDFIQDLKKVGLSDADLEPFFRSAEAFLQMWERIGARGAPPPTTTVTITPPPNEAGWHRTSVQVRVDAIGQLDGPSVAAVAVSATGADAREPAQTPGSATQVTIDAEGTTVLQLGGVDSEGNQEPKQSVTIRIDRVPPEVSPLVTPPPNDSGWHRGDVTVSLQGADQQSGVANCDGPFLLTGEGTNFSATGGCTDVASNVSAVIEVSGINIDRTPPQVTAPPPIERESPAEGTPAAALAAFLGAATAQDALDPAPAITHDAPPVFGLGTTTVRFTATDHAGHTATAESTVTLRARPVITWVPVSLMYGQALGSNQLNAATAVAGTFNYAIAAGTVLNAGVHTLRVSFEPNDPGRYLPATAEAPLTVLRAPLTITASDKSMILNSTLPELTVSYAGFVNGDTPASLDTPVSLSTAATGSMAGRSRSRRRVLPIRTTRLAFVAGTLQVLYSTGVCLGAPGHVVLPPVAADGTSVFKANRTVPVKFRVCDANGISIGTPGVVSSFRLVQQLAGTVATPVDETPESTTSNDQFRWDSDEAQWIFNLRTAELAVNLTYVFRITLNDRSAIEVRFGLR